MMLLLLEYSNMHVKLYVNWRDEEHPINVITRETWAEGGPVNGPMKGPQKWQQNWAPQPSPRPTPILQ